MVDTRYRVSARVVYSLKYHMVWCPKYRLRVLVGQVEKRLRVLLYQKAKELNAEMIALEVMPDHVHMFA
jgi:putative transposase